MIRSVKKVKNWVEIKNVFISVSNKEGLDILIPGLIKNCPDVTIYSTGGTYKAIKKLLSPEVSSKQLVEVSDYTGLPETEGGLVKSLHHKLFLGYLTETYSEAHQRDLEREKAVPIDLAVVNLYPFEKVVKQGASVEEARGNIDVGGPSALRAVGKNWHRVMGLADPHWYKWFLILLEENGGKTDLYSRFSSWKLTFKVLSDYDKAISDYLSGFLSFTEVKDIYEIV